MKLLMVTSRNIDKNGGENALIMGRHISLYKEYSIETDIIFFHKDTEINREVFYPGINFIKNVKQNLYNKLRELLKSYNYQGIVVSGFYDKEFTEFIKEEKKKYNFIYIVDIHATIKEIYEYCIQDLYHILGTRYLYLRNKKNFIKTLKIADYAFIVSNEEKVEVNNFLSNNNINFINIRCGCYSSIKIEDYFQIRKKQREIMKIDHDTLALVYSGSKDKWQKFEETLELYIKIQKTGLKTKFAFYMQLSEEEKQIIYFKLGKENVIIKWVAPEIMKEELMAYDIGILLRDNNWTNKVAFPNKYSDYIVSGLHLCLSSAVVDPYKITKKYGIEMLDTNNLLESLEQISNIRTNSLENYILVCKQLVENELLYDNQIKTQCTSLLKDMKIIKEVLNG